MKILRVNPAHSRKDETVCQFIGWPEPHTDLHFAADLVITMADVIESLIQLARPEEVRIDDRGIGRVLIEQLRARGYAIKAWSDPPTPERVDGR